MEQATHDASLQVQPLPPPERIRKGVVVAAEPVIVGNAAAYLCFSQVGLVNIETSLKNPKDRTIPPRAKQEPFSGVEYHFSSPDQPPQVITVGSPKREDGVRDFMPSKTTKVVAGADDVICDYDMIAATSSGDVIVPAYFLLKTLGIRAYLNTSVSTGDVSSQHHVLMILPTTEGTNVVLHLPPEVGNTQNALAAYIKSVLTGSAGIVKGKPAEEAKSARVTQTGGLIDMDTNRNGTVGLLEAAKEKYPAVRNNHTGLALGVLRAFVGGAKRFNGNLANDPALRTEGLEIDSDIIERERLRNFILEADLPTLLDVCDLFADTLAANPLTQRHLAAISESSGDFQPVSGDAILPPYLREVVGAVVLANLGGKVIKADDELIGQRMRLDSILRETQEIREQTTQAKKKLEERVTAHHDAKRILEQEKSMQLREIEAIAERNRAEFAQRRADFAREVDLETQLLREEKTRLAHKQRSELDKHEENLRQTLITIHSAHADFERQIAKGRAESGRRAETLGVLRQELARLDEQLADIKKRLADKRSQVETLEPQPKIKFKPITVNSVNQRALRSLLKILSSGFQNASDDSQFGLAAQYAKVTDMLAVEGCVIEPYLVMRGLSNMTYGALDTICLLIANLYGADPKMSGIAKAYTALLREKGTDDDARRVYPGISLGEIEVFQRAKSNDPDVRITDPMIIFYMYQLLAS